RPATPPRSRLGPVPAAPRTAPGSPGASVPPRRLGAARRAGADAGRPGGPPAPPGRLGWGRTRRPGPRRRPPATLPGPRPAASLPRSPPHLRCAAQQVSDFGPQALPGGPLAGGQPGESFPLTHAGQVGVAPPLRQRLADLGALLGYPALQLLAARRQVG